MPHPVACNKGKAQYEGKKFILERYHLLPYFRIGTVFGGVGNFKFYHQQGNCNRKNSIAEKSNAFYLEVLFGMPGSVLPG